MLISATLILGGIYLISVGGSGYYLFSGLSLMMSAIFLWRLWVEGVILYLLTLVATVAWSVWEIGYDEWALIPRIYFLAVISVIFLFRPVMQALKWRWNRVRLSGTAIYAVVTAFLVTGVLLRWLAPPAVPIDPLYQGGIEQKDVSGATLKLVSGAALSNGDWREYGGDSGGTHFSPLQQLTPNNVGKLTLVWSRRLTPDFAFETTPLKLDRRLYVCLSQRGVMALDAESGTVIWRSAAPKDDVAGACRGVAFYRVPDSSGTCSERIIASFDATKLVAIDARDGKLCAEFGVHGVVSLLTGMGEVHPGFYAVTSAPTIVRGKVVVGGLVLDSQYWGEPSGVIRAFDAVSGKLSWAWDMGNEIRTGEPPPGETYTPSTPNSWSPMSADEALGLIYVPTGNATGTDIFGARRRPFDEKYSSSVVALDVMTGRPRWSFQTTHHDLWDYDVGSQPTLVDAVTEHGVVHAVLQATKRGEIFVLDRTSGIPLYPVIEKPAPRRGAVPEEVLAPTQPFSVGLPSFGAPTLVEADMWGVTPIDQLWCRIKFREARYEGALTPPGLSPSIELPGVLGGVDWGGIAVDVDHGIVLVNSNRFPYYVRLITRANAKRLGVNRFAPSDEASDGPGSFRWSQEGSPYGAILSPFLSPLQLPCHRPPYGTLSAFNLRSGKLIWTRPFGVTRDLGPFGAHSTLPLPLGTPNLGGAIVTRGGLLFIAATMDRYFRAYRATTGELLWETELPENGMATPISYISPESGRQFVVITASDHVLAYALPNT